MHSHLKWYVSFIALAALLSGASVYAYDLGYRFDAEAGKCLNSKGEEGKNPFLQGECGELTGANFRGSDFHGLFAPGANLAKSYFTNANLKGADLTGAVLAEADLRAVVLRDARLAGANLAKAVLQAVDLRAADLSGADLSEALMREADLRGADLSRAIVLKTYLYGAKYDDKTVLPFDRARAGTLGMVYVK